MTLTTARKPASKVRPPHTEDGLQAMIAKRYPAPAYATLLHVRNQTGFSRTTRTADALVMSLYPSRGLDLMGFDIKCNRGDWRREIADPTKAEELYRYCDRWWVVAANEAIVQADELPSTWGLLVARGDRLHCKVEAPRQTAQPVGREFLAAVLRNVTETNVPRASIQTKLAEASAESYERGKEVGRREGGSAVGRLKELADRVEKFERDSGILIDHWDAGQVGKAAMFVAKQRRLGDFAAIATTAERIAQEARAAHEQIEAKLGGGEP